MPGLLRPIRVALVAALLVALSTGAAASANAAEGTVVRVEFDLQTSNGMRAHLETSEDEDVTLVISARDHQLDQAVTYEVPGEVSEAGLKVRFGRLGLIDVAFTPTVTLDETEPSPGCTGAPRTLREGVFAGTIEFAGERGYVRIEGPQAEGSMSVISRWTCPDEPGLNPFEPIPGVPQLSARAGGHEKESASLIALSRGCSCFFGAGVHHRHSGGRSIFYGASAEGREGMQIERGTSVAGPASAFDYDHEAGTATLRPPRPLRGHARYGRRAHARELWNSTIRVPLLGAAPLRTDGPGFRVDLSPEYFFD